MADRGADREHMQQMMAEIKNIQEMMGASLKEMMDASQAKADNSLSEIKEEIRSGQAEMKARVSAIEER
jgi:ElaB/YqjD/DUF883 family membrane-anchored ribosome-binding protein